MKIQLGQEQREALFPASIVLDDKLAIVALGPAVRGRFSEIVPGQSLLAHFRPMASGKDVTIPELSGTATVLNLMARQSSQVLNGWVIPYPGGYLLALRLTPTNYSLEDSGLQITDFAPGDPAVHAMLMFSIQRALLEEERVVALELDRARRQSQEMSDRISRAAGFLAHDFNNFLSIIKLNCDRLRLELKDQVRALRLVEIISGAASRGSAITRSLMTLSRQRGDTRIPVSIDALIDENQAFFVTALGTSVRLELNLGASGAQVMVSPVAALNCLVNLLINARDAMPGGGRVKLATRVVGAGHSAQDPELSGQVVIEVTDTGIGMAPEVSERVFEPLFSTKPNGNGLGLASVLEFAHDAGGQTWVASAPGVGTSVYVSLPNIALAEEAHLPGQCDAAARGGEAGPAGMLPDSEPHILVVEDEPFALEALCELLGASGLKVTGVSNSADALEQLRSGAFDVLISDIVLTGESGANLAHQASRLDPALKIILMSGYVPRDEEIDDDWMFLRKPIDARVVMEMLRVATRK